MACNGPCMSPKEVINQQITLFTQTSVPFSASISPRHQSRVRIWTWGPSMGVTHPCRLITRRVAVVAAPSGRGLAAAHRGGRIARLSVLQGTDRGNDPGPELSRISLDRSSRTRRAAESSDFLARASWSQSLSFQMDARLTGARGRGLLHLWQDHGR